jgi:acyl carrier protein
LAARFAAKEATIKALAPADGAPPWRSIEVRRHPGGRCSLLLHGEAGRLAWASGLDHWAVSLSHEGAVAVAVVVASRGVGPGSAGWPTDRSSVPPSCGPRLRSSGSPPGYSLEKEDVVLDEVIREELERHGRLLGGASSIGPEDDLYRRGLTSHATVNVMLALEERMGVEFSDDLMKKATFASVANIRAALVTLGCEDDR